MTASGTDVATSAPSSLPSLTDLQAFCTRLADNVERVIVGKREVIDLVIEGRAEEAQAILLRHGARGMPPGTTDEVASQAHIAQSSGDVPRQAG